MKKSNLDTQRNETKDTIKTESISTEETRQISHSAPVIVLITIVLMLILGGLFYWHSMVTTPSIIPTPTPERPTAETNKEPESTTATAQADNFNVLSTSDELSAIEADLESTNLDTLDLELNAIEAELEN